MWRTLHRSDRLGIAVPLEGKDGFWRQAGHQLTGTYRKQSKEQQHLETPLWKKNQRKPVLQEVRACGHCYSSLSYVLKSTVEPIKDHCNIFQKMTQTTELTKTLCSDQRGKKMPLSTGGTSGSHQGLSEVSPRGTQECSDPSVHSSNLCEETIKRNPVWWHHHTHVTFQHFLLRDSRFKNGTKFKLLGRMPAFLAFHQRLTSSTVHLCFPSTPLSCLQHSFS